MTAKTHIIDALGEAKLLLPTLLNEALSANDRAKFYFTVLQLAQARADAPLRPSPEIASERAASGVEEDVFDSVPGHSVRLDSTRYCVPRSGEICRLLEREVATMLEPISASGAAGGEALAKRLDVLAAEPWCDKDDVITAAQISRLTSGSRAQGDSLHLLVMDAHKALNALQASIASENIGGAAAYEVQTSDRPLISAFMRGIAATSELKFEHPGLNTTATRCGDRLVIQNDIGTTDAHVLVVHVEDRTVTLTYTDIHIQRLLFFQSLFEHWPVQWQDTLSRTDQSMESGLYHLCTGTFSANSQAAVNDYLCFLGSRLVFLIDWNRARKRLRTLLAKKESLALLKWAADENIGHMGWLLCGGEQIISDALSFLARSPAAFGTRLDNLLDSAAAVDFMKFVLRTCAHSLLDDSSQELVRDEIRAELARHLQSARQQLLDIAAEHAALSVEIATSVRDGLLDLRAGSSAELRERHAARAKEWEHLADGLVNQAREQVQHAETGADFYRDLLECADDIADELEEAAFHLTLPPADVADAKIQDTLSELAGLLVSSTQEYVKALEAARSVRRGALQEDTRDFLEAIHRIMSIERDSDEAQRAVKRALTQRDGDFRVLYVFSECARNLEAAADALMHTALKLRDYVLEEVRGN